MNCAHFADYPCPAGDPSRCRGASIRRLCELAGPEGWASYARLLAENPPSSPPAGPPADAPPPRPPGETLRLRGLVEACDYREPLEDGERCSCEGELARCRAGRSLKSDLTVTRHECELCVRGKLGMPGRSPPPSER